MRISRRDMLKLSAISGLAAFAAACRASLFPTAQSSATQTAPVKPTKVGNPSATASSASTASATATDSAAPTATSGPMQADVIVIGAGMAGLAAASQLAASGKSVIIVEGRERIGGRMWTDHALSMPLDMGASWIHGIKDNPLSALADRFGAKRVVTDYESIARYDFDGRALSEAESRNVDQSFETLMNKVYALQENLDTDISLQAAIDRSLKNRPRALEYAINTEIEHDYGADVSDLSLFEWDQDGEFFGDDVLFPNGYEQLVNGLAQGLDIRTATPVTQIDYADKTVRVLTERGAFRCQQAIVTLPLGVLQRGSVTFSPALPAQKQRAISRLKMGLLNKLYLKFPSVFWEDDVHLLGYISESKGQWCEWYNMHKYTGQPVLLGFNAGTYGAQIETQPDGAIVAGAMSVLRRIYGTKVPAPEGYSITRWMSDPFSFGSYSHIPPGASGADYVTLSRPVAQRLFFAGEATHRAYPGTVHGAYLSGLRAADEIRAL